MNLRLFPVLTYLSGFSVWFATGISLPGLELRATDLIGLLLILVVILQLGKVKAKKSDCGPGLLRPPILTTFFAITVVLIIISGFMSSLGAQDVAAVLSFILRYVFGLLFFLSLISMQKTLRNQTALMNGLLAGGITSVLIGSLGFLIPSIGAFSIRYGDRLQGFTNHPNQLGMMLSASLPIILALIGSRRKPQILWASIIVFGTGIAMTGSKANLALGAAIILLTLVIFSRLKTTLLKRLQAAGKAGLITMLVAATGLFTLSASSPRTITTIQRLIDEPTRVTAVVSRSEMWDTALQLGLTHPWTGVGGNNSYIYLPHAHAHNVFFEFFMTLGFPGLFALAVLVSLLVVLITRAWITSRNNPTSIPPQHRLLMIAAPLGTFTYLLANLSSDSFGGSTLPIFWVLLSISLANLRLSRLARRRHKKNAASVVSDVS